MIQNIFLLGVLLCTSSSMFAQADVISNNFITDTNFISVIIVGILLALGFQFLLTTLSVALGIVSIGNIKEAYVSNKYSQYGLGDDDDDDDSSSMSTGLMITSAFGIWNVLTLSLALFTATFLALQLSTIESTSVNLSISLVIWASFFMLMFYLESSLVSSIVGSLINTVLSGLRASGDAVKSMFMPSTTQQTQQLIDNTIKTVRNELSSANLDTLDTTLNTFLDKVDNRIPSYEKLKSDIQEIVKDNNNNPKTQDNAAKWTAIQTAIQTTVENGEKIANSTKQGKEKLKQLANLATDIKAEYDKGNSTKASLSKVASKVSTLDEQEAKAQIQQLIDAFQQATPNDFNTNALQERVTALANDASKMTSEFQRQLQSLDKAKIVDVLAKNTSLERKNINNYANKAEALLQEAQAQVLSALDTVSDKENWKHWAYSIENSIKEFIDSTDDNALNYSLLKSDFRNAMNNPQDSLAIIKHRLNTFDRDTFVSIITNNKRINRSDIQQVVAQLEQAQQEVMQQIKTVEDTARAKIANIERRAVIQAEAVRRTMAAAAIWLLLTMVFSGAAAVLGGLIELG